MTDAWWLRAKCRGDKEFEERVMKDRFHKGKVAAVACEGCPVIRECARDCFQKGEDGGLVLRDCYTVRGGVYIGWRPGPTSYQYARLLEVAELAS